MSKRKGMSAEEKRDKMLEIFHESKDVFVLKDIEKLSVKKGIVLQSVKDVLQSLVDDDLVHQERIGASNFFWSFPSEAAVKIQSELTKQEGLLQQLKKQRHDLEEKTEAAQVGRENSDERTQLLKERQELQSQLAAQQEQLAAYADNDPEKFEAMRNAAEIARDASNRWLDNLYALKSWAKKRFEGNEHAVDEFFQQCGMTDSMDYLD